MHTEKQPQESTWEENILNALYYAFAASDAEGRAYFLNLVLENSFKRPSFLPKLYETVTNIRSENIFEVSEETWAWVEFWREFDNEDKEKIPAQIARLHGLQNEEALSWEGRGALYFLLAAMEGRRDEHRAAVELYEQSTQFLPDFLWTYNNWGNHLAELDQHEQAVAKYKKAIELDPKYASAFYNWGKCLGAMGHHEQAIEKYQRAIELDPKSAKAHNNWGTRLAVLGQHEQAIKKYQKAIELDPKLAAAYQNWGNSLVNLGQREQAIEKYQKASELDPKNDVAYNYWGYTAILIGRLEEAVEQLKKAMELDPKDYTAPINLGIAYYRLQQIEEGKKYFERALENCRESSANCQLNKATALLGLERTEEARAQLQETVAAFKLSPSEQKEFMTAWQLLATAPAPPAGMEEFMALAKKLFEQAE